MNETAGLGLRFFCEMMGILYGVSLNCKKSCFRDTLQRIQGVSDARLNEGMSKKLRFLWSKSADYKQKKSKRTRDVTVVP